MKNRHKTLLFLAIFGSQYMQATPSIFESIKEVKTKVAAFHNSERARHLTEFALVLGATYFMCIDALPFFKHSFYSSHLKELKGYSSADIYSKRLNRASYKYFSNLTKFGFKRLFCKLWANLTPEEITAYRREIVRAYNMYHFYAFVEVIRNWPEYRENILYAYQRILNEPQFVKELNAVYGLNKNELKDFIEQEARFFLSN